VSAQLRDDVVLVPIPRVLAESYRRGWSPRMRIRLEPTRDGFWRLLVQPCEPPAQRKRLEQAGKLKEGSK